MKYLKKLMSSVDDWDDSFLVALSSIYWGILEYKFIPGNSNPLVLCCTTEDLHNPSGIQATLKGMYQIG